MKFLCGSCRTKYQISDDKVRGKILTIRCKKCGAKVVVKESLARQSNLVIAPLADEEARAEVSAPKLALGGSAASVQGSVSSASLSSAFDVAMGGGLDDMPTSIAPTPQNEAHAGIEWYVAIDGSQVGPFAFGELIKKIQNKDVIGRHYAWHDGFDNWRRVREIADLASYIPPDPAAKKKPPPSPPADEGAKVVDFAQKRAERDKRVGAAPGPADDLTAGLENLTAKSVPSPAGPEPGVRGRDREEQLDSVLNAALGIENEGQTARAEPNTGAQVPAASIAPTTPAAKILNGGAAATAQDHTSPGANALNSPAGTPSGALSDEAFKGERSSDSFLPEDLFDKVPRASANEMVGRESTRFFVAAAGVNSQKKKNRFGIAGAVIGGIAVVAFFGLWAGGVIPISIPGIGNPFERTGPAVPEELELAFTAEEQEELKKLFGKDREELVEKIKKKKRVAKAKTPIGYVSDDPRGTDPGGSRGANAPEGASIGGLGGGGSANNLKTETRLPESGGPVVAAPDGTLTNDVISRIVKENVSAVIDCSRRERTAKQDLKGKLEFSLTVEPDGGVSKVTVQTPAFRGTSLAACISDRMKNWRFPTFSGPAQAIVVPFVFTSD